MSDDMWGDDFFSSSWTWSENMITDLGQSGAVSKWNDDNGNEIDIDDMDMYMTNMMDYGSPVGCAQRADQDPALGFDHNCPYDTTDDSDSDEEENDNAFCQSSAGSCESEDGTCTYVFLSREDPCFEVAKRENR